MATSSSNRVTKVAVIPTSSPSDVSGLQAEVERGSIIPSEIVAILGKTEGNGCVNDFTRGYTTDTLTAYLTGVLGITATELHERVSLTCDPAQSRLAASHYMLITLFPYPCPSQVAIVMSGGTEGGLCPHLMVFSVSSAPAALQEAPSEAANKSMAIGVGFTRDFLPEEQGTLAQVGVTCVLLCTM
jgi:cyanuric acid amidohydrolase